MIETTTLIENNIMDFSIDIDKNDRFHLLCITKKGDLQYYIYVNGKWLKNTLTKLNVKSNHYKYLTVKFVKNSIHIFYSYSNLINSQIWTIVHIVGYKDKWEKKNIISITPGKFMSPFFIDYDKFDNIHLIYSNMYKGIQHIYYTSFSSFLKRWMPAPKKISDLSADNIHPYMFIDRRNTVHVVWSILDHEKIKLQYKQLPSSKNYKNNWKNIKLPSISSKCTFPLVFESNNNLKIQYKANNQLNSLISDNYGATWHIDESINNISIDDITFIEYGSNYNVEKLNSKINHIYGDFKENIILYGTNLLMKSVKSSNHSLNNLSSMNNKTRLDSTNRTDILPNKHTISHTNTIKINLDNSNRQPSSSNDFKEQGIKSFVSKNNLNIDSMLSKAKRESETKNNIEENIYKNVKELDEKIVLKKNDFNKIIKQLENLELLIEKYKEESKEFTETLEAIKEKNNLNDSQISEIQSQISEIKDIISNSNKSNILERILNIFK
ncbi:hypothetical protein [Caldisalinibacter kiritimatiensis]|uniref:hypothetical protein n=1 Tax=Caldisalinibacter kiritimatiensis TaxID=1304284 RepID=UPI0004BB4F8D|nr:hypothetical protein [Caldisalinibacter kiritimatiensis]